MAKEFIQVGDKIEMRLSKRRTMGEVSSQTETYISQLLQKKGEKTAIISVPMQQGGLVTLLPNHIYELSFFTQSGVYFCQAKIMRRLVLNHNFAAVEIEFITPLKKIQRRQFYRLNCLAPIKYVILSEEQLNLYKEFKLCPKEEKVQKKKLKQQIEQQPLEYQDATMLDISGGGIRFNAKEEYTEGELLLIKSELFFEFYPQIPYLFGRVISSVQVDSILKRFDVRVEFIELQPEERETIVTYVFQEERNNRKKETGLVK